MNDGPKISIITACFNAAETIEQTIQSVINQTYNNIEYIVVDGASTDGTIEIIEKYRSQIDIIISEPDKGIYDAFNKGLRRSTGNYVQYLNADDYLIEEDIIEKVANSIIIANYPVLMYGGILKINDLSGYVTKLNREISFSEIKSGMMIPHPASFIKRESILQCEGFDSKYKIAADYDLVSKLYLRYANQIVYIPLLITMFREGGISTNLNYSHILEKEVQHIVSINFGEVYVGNDKNTNDLYYKKWLTHKLFNNKSISNLLIDRNIQSVAIFGSGEVSNLIAKDCLDRHINVLAFLDNDVKRHQIKMNNVTVVSPSWLIDNGSMIHSVIMGFEGNHEKDVIKQLEEYKLPSSVQIYSWRQLVSML